MSTVTDTSTGIGPQSTGVAHQMVFVNLPVDDLARSREFFTTVGYEFDERMCNDMGLGVKLGENIYAMLLGRDFFASFHKAETAENGKHEVLTCLSATGREEVDTIVDRAVGAGGTEIGTSEQGDFMYGRSYTDLDGHIWEILWMDVTGATEAGVFG